MEKTYINSIFKVALINENKIFVFKGDYEKFIKTYCREPLSYIMAQSVNAAIEQQKILLREISTLNKEERALKKLQYIYSHYAFNHIQVISVEFLGNKKTTFMNETLFDKFLFV